MTTANMGLVLSEEKAVQWQEVSSLSDLKPDHVRLRVEAVALNHLDLFSRRGMAFSKRKLPIIAGVEGAGRILRVGAEVEGFDKNDRVVVYPGDICGKCVECISGRENLCSTGEGILGFHLDGVAAEEIDVPARLVRKVPDSLPSIYAACAPVTYATVVHMLCTNAKLQAGETVLVHAAGSGIGSLAIKLANHIGAGVFATVGSDAKIPKARQLGAHHVINYSEKPFHTIIRRITEGTGVDVVFEHVGQATWRGSMLSLAKGGRLVTCGATSGPRADLDLMHLFNRQIKILASFGGTIADMEQGLRFMSESEVLPHIDSVVRPQDIESQFAKLADRNVFGKIVIDFTGEQG
ncbi:zinc-binding dehydrogenase [uncultured Erythrobacter sp.]|uniref:zinc-binding dehydrogenase n=1 Tax=uncultured Erythrobacter sp. TaxID=263913 RepID=UPI0026174420|nr:zinc-binding dehydrogenase [uncultured Erythrobacter sp.]